VATKAAQGRLVALNPGHYTREVADVFSNLGTLISAVPSRTFAHTRGYLMARTALVGLLLLAVGNVGLAQKEKSKIDKAKLIGTWTLVKTDSKEKPPPGAMITMEFNKNGTFKRTVTTKDKTQMSSGTYTWGTIKENKLYTLTYLSPHVGRQDEFTVKELTDKKLVADQWDGERDVPLEFKK
jgi:uncharacterized protein (TIGR03066 family)